MSDIRGIASLNQAVIDLCLHMIRCDHGADVAAEAARRNVVPPHRGGGQAQFIRQPVPSGDESSTAAVRTWMLSNLDRLSDPDRLSNLDRLARKANMSKRTFTRRFCEETGMSPIQWLNQQRIDRARQLLETTSLPVDQVAEQSGFATPGSLRLHLQKTLGISPTAYRTTFRGAPR